MKITEVDGDGLGVSAVIAAAGKVRDLLDERGVTVGMAGDALVVFAKDWAERGRVLGATIEPNPRLLLLEGEPGPEPPARSGSEHEGEFSHYYDDDGVLCVCTKPCCHDQEVPDRCICLVCTDETHTHG